MGFDDAYQLGYIKKTHGLSGSVLLYLDVDDALYYKELESVFLNQAGALVPFFITSLQIRGNEAIASFEDFQSIEEVKHLVGTELWLPTSMLPDLPDGAFYYHQLVGYQLYDDLQLVGKVETIYSLPNNQLLGVLHDETQKEVLVPTQDGVMIEVNHEHRTIRAILPEGLLDLYLSEA
ncbi:MAG: ribosome maturation factor RimM [Bacteroidota bacterium]